MAFDFLGTLSLEQLRSLRSFVEQEIESIDAQINYLLVEIDNAKRTQEELGLADKAFGGDALNTIYESHLPPRKTIPDQDDENSARIIEQVKAPFIKPIKFKRERLEYKVKKNADYIEQLREEVDRKLTAKTQTTELLNEVEQLFNADNANHLFRTTEQLQNYQQGI